MKYCERIIGCYNNKSEDSYLVFMPA